MTELLNSIYDANDFRNTGYALIDKLAMHLQKKTQRQVINFFSPNELLAFWQNDWTEQPQAVMPFFEQIIQQSISLHHPQYMGHQVVPPAPLTALADLLAAFLNNGSAVYEMGQASSAIEKLVAEVFCKAIGYSQEADGLLTSGGTLANLTALLCARQAKTSQVWEEGYTQELAIMVSEEAHYCVDRAARIMGLGTEGIIKVPVDEKFRMRTDLLTSFYQQAEYRGKKVIAVVGSACSTSTGSYDDLEAIAQFCQKYDLWFHIDGAHGGAVVFTHKYKHLVKGIEKADSIAIDCHKMLMTPALTTALLFKNGRNSYQTFVQKAQYLWTDAEEREWYNYSKRTFECTKLMMSIKFYALIRTYGIQALEDFVNTLYDLGKTFAKMIQANPHFELAVEPMANIICFRLLKKGYSNEKLNQLNAHIRREIVEKGEFYIVQTKLKDKLYLRTTLMNPFTTEVELEKLLEQVEKIGNEYS